MAGQHGIKETKDCLDAGFAILNAVKLSAADGNISIADFGNLLSVFPSISPALDGIALVPKELGELDAADSAELLAYAGLKLGMSVGDAGLISKINGALKIALAIGEALPEFKK